MPRKRTRDGSKTEDFKLRMSKEDMKKLDETSKKLGISKSEVLREGISSQYSSVKNGE